MQDEIKKHKEVTESIKILPVNMASSNQQGGLKLGAILYQGFTLPQITMCCLMDLKLKFTLKFLKYYNNCQKVYTIYILFFFFTL